MHPEHCHHEPHTSAWVTASMGIDLIMLRSLATALLQGFMEDPPATSPQCAGVVAPDLQHMAAPHKGKPFVSSVYSESDPFQYDLRQCQGPSTPQSLRAREPILAQDSGCRWLCIALVVPGCDSACCTTLLHGTVTFPHSLQKQF